MQELFCQCRDYVIKEGRFPHKDEKYKVLDKVYEKIEEREIWIPYDEVYKHFLSKVTKLKNRLIKEGLLIFDNKRLKLFRKVILPLTVSVDGYILDDCINGDEECEKEVYKETSDTFITEEGLKENDLWQMKDNKESKEEKLIELLRQDKGKHILILGRREFIYPFIQKDLIDEYIIRIKPVVGEREKYRFTLPVKVKLELISIKREGEDVVINYQRKKE